MEVTKGTTSLASQTDRLKVGDEAPDFELRSHLGDVIRLSQMRGKNVVIAFYPAAWTAV
jgi:peroxiredoxin